MIPQDKTTVIFKKLYELDHFFHSYDDHTKRFNNYHMVFVY